MIEVAALAGIVAQVLVPFVKRGATRLASELASSAEDTAAEYAAETAATIWDRVRSVFSSDADRHTVEEFERYPEDTERTLKRKLEEKLESDPELAAELERLVQSEAPGGGGNVIQILGNGGFVDLRYAHVSGNTVIGGYIGQVVRGEPPSDSAADVP